MALSWLTALKAVPWTDVVQAAPGIVQGARKLFTAAKSYAGAKPGDTDTPEKPVQGEGVGARMQRCEQAVAALQKEQQASADLIRSLAEQNAIVVTALDRLRKRIRILSWVCVFLVLSLGAIVLLAIAK